MPVELTDGLRNAGRDKADGDGFTLKGSHVLSIFIAFFVVVGSVNAVMLSQALRTMPGLDARNGYDVSQRYNGEIAAAAAQDSRGWRAEAAVALDRGEAAVMVSLRDKAGAPIDRLVVTAALRHPSDRRRDRAVTLAAVGGGAYRASLPDMTAGAWDLVIEARPESEEARAYLSRRRIALKS